MKRAHPAATVTVWAMDEHRLGLLPVVRRVWAPRGQRPIAPVRRRYQWLYVYGLVRPRTGQTWWALLPRVSTEAFSLALREFARDEGIGPLRRAVLVLDQAGWHTAKGLTVPDEIHLVFLPPYSPELQPAERLWELVDAPVANRSFPDLDALEATLVQRCRDLERQRNPIKTRTRYHWWPHERHAQRPQ
ncbi:MAG: IS630 family transposase [Chloroflexota bacterium]|nr:IS630 family transposase [Chloroflexota bacterium]MDP9469893.1 IS630 family transposase [Chloroflexota bacterium]